MSQNASSCALSRSLRVVVHTREVYTTIGVSTVYDHLADIERIVDKFGGWTVVGLGCLNLFQAMALATLLLGMTRVKLMCLSIGTVVVDTVLDVKTVFGKIGYTMKQFKWMTLGLVLLLINPIRVGITVGLAEKSASAGLLSAFGSPLEVISLGYKSIRDGEEHPHLAAAKYEEVLFESIPQFNFQAYVMWWMHQQKAECKQLNAVSHHNQSWAFAHSYWECDRAKEPAWQVGWTQYASVGMSFALLAFGSAEWAKKNYDRKGLKVGWATWLAASLCKCFTSQGTPLAD
mmetsp:Transcript_133834/g.427873  ORF Transcript_133834/g.427873 Transcript_133834/m.427873 type:complete len:289 (-) Transcript_133834:276-1142(-)